MPPAEPPAPEHPMYAMTTYELRDYRKSLERAINDKVIGQAPVAQDLRVKLDEVLAEQEQRDNIRHGVRKSTHGL